MSARAGPPRLCALGRTRIELPLVHARDRDFGEHAGFRQRVAVDKRLSFGARLHIDDQKAADELRAVVVRRSAGNNQNIFLATQIVDVGLQALFAFFGKVGCGYARYGSEHKEFLSVESVKLIFCPKKRAAYALFAVVNASATDAKLVAIFMPRFRARPVLLAKQPPSLRQLPHLGA